MSNDRQINLIKTLVFPVLLLYNKNGIYDLKNLPIVFWNPNGQT